MTSMRQQYTPLIKGQRNLDALNLIIGALQLTAKIKTIDGYHPPNRLLEALINDGRYLIPRPAANILCPPRPIFMHLFTFAASAAVMAIPVWGWGKEGHKMTAAIAQIHLLPSTREAICSILPGDSNCNLANVATWPDDVRREEVWKWSANLHFVNGIDDSPPKDCSFGTKGWTKPLDHHILNAIVNMTGRVGSSNRDNRDFSLRFLTHFLGDIHQPLHLTGRYFGGNLVPVLFGTKETRLHTVWDDDLVMQRIESVESSAYAHWLQTSGTALDRNRQIEAALTGSNYDPLVRWIVLEGIDGLWATEIKQWTTCPQITSTNRVEQQIMRLQAPPFNDPTNLPVCPYHWAKASHQLLCDFIWRPDLEGVKDWKNAVFKIMSILLDGKRELTILVVPET